MIHQLNNLDQIKKVVVTLMIFVVFQVHLEKNLFVGIKQKDQIIFVHIVND